MNPLDSYLERVAHELRSMPQAKRNDELRELRSHLKQRVEDFVRDGLSPEAAQTRAIHEFGAPRALGIKLREAWEVGSFSTKRLLSGVGRVTLFWFCATIQLLAGAYAQRIWPENALFPELTYLVPLTALCVPLVCGWLWSQCLGSRRQLIPLLFFVVAFNLLFVSACLAYVNGWGWNWTHPTTEPFYNLILALNPVLAVIGSVFTNAMRRKRGHLALTSGQTTSATRFGSIKWNTQRVQLCMGLIIGIGCWRHIHLTLHPSTPVSTLHASLLTQHNPRYDSVCPIDIPTIIELRELPALTSAEMAGNERRVFFKVETHAHQRTAQLKVKYFKSCLPLPGKHTPQVKNRIRQSIATLERNSQIIEGTARLIQTPDGWQVDERSFDRSKLWAWLYIATNPSESNLTLPQ